MLRLGLLGGMSWREQRTVRPARQRAGRASASAACSSAECVLYSVDFGPVEKMQAEGRWDDAGRLLAAAARSLELGGADLLLLCTNTMQQGGRRHRGRVTIQLLHIAEATASSLRPAYRYQNVIKLLRVAGS